MDDISIRLLDVLFDLCDVENYVIVEKEDLTSRISDYAFETDEITELLEALSADGLIDLKYADNEEFCVAMKTKGRALIKQSRERLQKLIEADGAALKREATSSDDALSAKEGERTSEEDKPLSSSALREDPISPEPTASREELLRVRREMRRERARAESSAPRQEESARGFTASSALSRGYAVRSSADREEGKPARADKRTFLYAFLGAAAGALLINVIFLIIFLVKFGG